MFCRPFSIQHNPLATARLLWQEVPREGVAKTPEALAQEVDEQVERLKRNYFGEAINYPQRFFTAPGHKIEDFKIGIPEKIDGQWIAKASIRFVPENPEDEMTTEFSQEGYLLYDPSTEQLKSIDAKQYATLAQKGPEVAGAD